MIFQLWDIGYLTLYRGYMNDFHRLVSKNWLLPCWLSYVYYWGSQEEYHSCCIPALKAGTSVWGNVLGKKSHRNLKIRIEDLPVYYNWIRKNREEKKINWKCQFVLTDHEYKYMSNFSNYFCSFFHYKEK